MSALFITPSLPRPRQGISPPSHHHDQVIHHIQITSNQRKTIIYPALSLVGGSDGGSGEEVVGDGVFTHGQIGHQFPSESDLTVLRSELGNTGFDLGTEVLDKTPGDET